MSIDLISMAESGLPSPKIWAFFLAQFLRLRLPANRLLTLLSPFKRLT